MESRKKKTELHVELDSSPASKMEDDERRPLKSAGSGGKPVGNAAAVHSVDMEPESGGKTAEGGGGAEAGWYEKWARPCVGEFVGTTLFVYMLCMTSNSPATAAIGAGFTLFIVINIVGHVSGAHVNPAVTVGALLAGRMQPVLALMYVVTQLLAGMLAAAMYRGSVSTDVYTSTAGAATILADFRVAGGRSTNEEEGILIEMLMTSILVLAVQVTALDPVSKNPLASLAIGFSISACATIGGGYTGCSLNPARSFGPAAVWSMTGMSGEDAAKHDVWAEHYVYWLGPLLGACVAAAIYRLLLSAPDNNIIGIVQRKRGKNK